jgi:hypothetical protein
VRPADGRAVQLDAFAVALHYTELGHEVAGGGAVVMHDERGIDADSFQ